MSTFEAPPVPVPSARFNHADTWSAYGGQWSSGERKLLQCCAVHSETHDVKTFTFRCPDIAALSFEPGQFITVSPCIGGQTVSRCYTLASSPTRPFTFAITVKRVPRGVVSNWLHDNLRPGDTLPASGPSGTFTPVGRPSGKLLYLSAGVGITPLMAMARAGFDLAAELDTVFVHSARTPNDIPFAHELEQLQARQRRFRLLTICEGRGDTPDWSGPIGRLDAVLLNAQVPDLLDREVFVCGPQGYMDAVQGLLRQAGFDFTHYHQESFDIVALALEPPAPAADSASELFTVTLARSGKTFSMGGGQTLLAAAKMAGAIVPSSCGQGVCGTCKTTVLQGTVEMKHNGGIRQREIDKGLRLLCCSTPTSDVLIDL